MLTMIKNLIRFRMNQKMARTAARGLGFKKLAGILGLMAGYRAIRKH